MTSIEVVSNGKPLTIEITETWDFIRDVHGFQAHVVDKEAYQRHIVGRYDTREIAEQKAREWIASS